MKKLLLLSLMLIFSSCGGPSEVEKLRMELDELKNGKKFSAVFVSDDKNFEQKINQVKQNIFKNLQYTIIGSDTEQGKKYIKTFNAKNLPLMIAGKGIEDSQIKQYLSQLTTKVGEEYNVDIAGIASQMKVNIGKIYLKVPQIFDFDVVKGPKNAKVTIIEISDFECPYCKRFYDDTYHKLVKAYGKKVKFVFKNLPLGFHKKAQKASEALQCARKQGKGFQMHDKIFANQKYLSVKNYKKYARQLRINAWKFNKCLDSGETKKEIEAQMKQAGDFGVSGTPGFFINNQFLGGAYPFESFKEIIDAELAK